MNGILSVSSFCEVCSAVSRSISWARCLPFFTLKVYRADEKRSEIWEPAGNVGNLLGDRFAKGEREKMATVWDSARMYVVANVQSYHVRKECQRHCRIQCERSRAVNAIQAQ